MASTIINLTLLKVNEELENLLDNSLDPTYRIVLNDPDLRQKLIVYVLNRIPNRHMAIEIEKVSLLTSQFLVLSTQESLKMEKLIRQGIYYLIQKYNSHDFMQAYTYIDSLSIPNIGSDE
jgi:hypothetical protein